MIERDPWYLGLAICWWKFEKNKSIEQLYSKNKLRENFIFKISVRTSKTLFPKKRKNKILSRDLKSWPVNSLIS